MAEEEQDQPETKHALAIRVVEGTFWGEVEAHPEPEARNTELAKETVVLMELEKGERLVDLDVMPLPPITRRYPRDPVDKSKGTVKERLHAFQAIFGSVVELKEEELDGEAQEARASQVILPAGSGEARGEEPTEGSGQQGDSPEEEQTDARSVD